MAFPLLLACPLPAEPAYPPAKWESTGLPMANVSLTPAEKLLLANALHDLAAACSAELNGQQRSHLLAIALHLEPEHEASVVLNGQWIRGLAVEPKGNEPPASILEKLEPLVRRCFTQPVDHVLGQHLLAALHPVSPAAAKWAEELVPGVPLDQLANLKLLEGPERKDAKGKWAERELIPTFPIKQVSLSFLKRGEKEWSTKEATLSTATLADPLQKLEHQGSQMALDLVKPETAPLQHLLAPWHPVLPTGAELRLDAWPFSETERLESSLAYAVCLDSLLTGRHCSPHVWLAVGLRPDTAALVDSRHTEEILSVLEYSTTPASEHFLVTGKAHATLLAQWVKLSPQLLPLLAKRPLCEAATYRDVAGMAATPLTPKLEEARSRFNKLTKLATTRSNGWELLKSETGITELQAITSIHPQNVSARILLEAVTGKLPKAVSPMAAERFLLRFAGPLWRQIFQADTPNEVNWKKAQANADLLDRQCLLLRPTFPPEGRVMLDNLRNSITLLRSWFRDPPLPSRERQRLHGTWRSLLKARQGHLAASGMAEVLAQVYGVR